MGTKERVGHEKESRRKKRKNHDAIIFVPARERILRPSSPSRWTEEETEQRKLRERKAEGQGRRINLVKWESP